MSLLRTISSSSSIRILFGSSVISTARRLVIFTAFRIRSLMRANDASDYLPPSPPTSPLASVNNQHLIPFNASSKHCPMRGRTDALGSSAGHAAPRGFFEPMPATPFPFYSGDWMLVTSTSRTPQPPFARRFWLYGVRCMTSGQSSYPGP